MRISHVLTLALGGLLCVQTAAEADYKADIGFTQLSLELGGSMPTGSGVAVSQVEAAEKVTIDMVDYFPYSPNPALSHNAGKTLTPRSGVVMDGGGNPLYSGHAGAVGSFYYGLGSVAPAITSIDTYSADDWLVDGVLNLQSMNAPDTTLNSSRVANHSWIGYATDDMNNFDRLATLEMIERTDWLVATDDYHQIAGTTGFTATYSLLSNSFNAMSVVRLNDATSGGSANLHAGAMTIGPYTGGRDIVDFSAPNINTTSNSVPVVGGLTALLIQVADANPMLSHDSWVNRAGQTIRSATTSEVIKAMFMAGALRNSPAMTNTYTVTTANNLDSQYGAGLVNIYNSYHILVAGEQDSDQDDGAGSGAIDYHHGFDYDAHFGAAANNDTGSYYFTTGNELATFFVTLAWNVNVDMANLTGGSPDPDAAAVFYNLDLKLFDITLGNLLVASSLSTHDNTENLMVNLDANHQYELRVLTASGQPAFDWDYGLAWRSDVTPIPEPGAIGVWLAVMGLAGLRRRR
ncbi:MAG: hypothetical protein GC162_03325 [Planctomycetes bacterium]|nr:hypothetical protein [Planctomycetota bacterium]